MDFLVAVIQNIFRFVEQIGSTIYTAIAGIGSFLAGDFFASLGTGVAYLSNFPHKLLAVISMELLLATVFWMLAKKLYLIFSALNKANIASQLNKLKKQREKPQPQIVIAQASAHSLSFVKALLAVASLAFLVYSLPQKYQLTDFYQNWQEQQARQTSSSRFSASLDGMAIVATDQKESAHGLVLAETDSNLADSIDNSDAGAKTIQLTGTLTDVNGKMVEGTETIRFAIYSKNRTEVDPYPSDSDKEQRIWEETQTVTLRKGVFKVELGKTNNLPATLSDKNAPFYLAVRVGNDSEMVPRKKIIPSFYALNAQNAITLEGKKIGNQAGDIPLLNQSGQIDLANLPIGKNKDQLVLGNDPRLDNPLKLSGESYLSLSGQKLTVDKITLSSQTQGTLSIAQGGTGLSKLNQGDLLYYQSGSQLTTLAIGGENQVLTIQGGLPSWQNIQSTAYSAGGSLLQLTGTAFSLKEGTLNNGKICTYSTTSGLVCNTEPSSGGIETDPIFSAHIANTITATNISDWNVAYANRLASVSTPLSFSSNVLSLPQANGSTSGYLSNSDWSTFNAKLTSALTSGYLFVGNASNVATGVAMSGDVTISNTGLTSIGADKITEAMLKESTGAPQNGNILTYNSSTQGFTWVSTAPGTAHPLLSSTHSDTDSLATLNKGDILYELAHQKSNRNVFR